MRPFLIASTITVIVGLIFAGLFSIWSDSTKPKSLEAIGKIEDMEKNGFPNFGMQLLDGSKIELHQFKGKVVIVNFWASWCAPCLEEFPSMFNLMERLGDKAELIAISQDSSRSDIDAFLKSFPKLKEYKNIKIAWDEKHEIAQIFQTERLPESYVLDKDMKLSKKIVGSIDWATADAVKFLETLAEK